ncbi:hypothetical protein [Desulfotruncus arcticus]|nr:hypothetical protein [Desulfotruncus arcticus]
MSGIVIKAMLAALVFTIAITQRIRIFGILRNRSKHMHKMLK